MASYSAPVTCAASSTANYSIRLAAGEFRAVAVEFPGGCKSLVQVRIFLNESQVFPSDAGQYYTGDGKRIDIQGAAGIPIQGSSILRINVVNDDDTYAHTPLINVEVTEPIRRLGDAKAPGTPLMDMGKASTPFSISGLIRRMFS